MTNGEQQIHVPLSPRESPGADNERNGAWRLLLPPTIDGRVALVDLDPGIAAAFRRSYPQAITVSSDPAALVGVDNGTLWDGHRWPLADGAVALLVVDERRADPAALATALAAGGIRASIVPARRGHGIVPYPHPEALESLLSPRWPPSTRAPRRWVRERIATSPAWRLTRRAGLIIDGSRDGLVDEVVADVGRVIGGEATLRGFLVSSGDNVVLRVALGRHEVAVRVALTELGAARLAQQRAVLAGVEAALTAPDLRAHLPREVGLGTTHGLPWRAETWHAGHLQTRGRRWSARAPSWDAAHGVARLLTQTAPSGSTDREWARVWATGMDQFGEEAAARLTTALLPLEEARFPTSWCHGDLWPGNVVLSRGPAVVIDWEQGRPTAPAGVDGVFLELNRLMLSSDIPFGLAAARAASDPGALISPPDVGGMSWPKAPGSLRAAIVVAAVIVHAIGPKGDRRGPAWGQRHLSPLLSVLEAQSA